MLSVSVGILHLKGRERLERDVAVRIGGAVRVDKLERDVVRVIIGTGVLQHFVAERSVCVAEQRVRLDRDDTPAAGPEKGTDRQEVGLSGADIDEDAVGRIPEEVIEDCLVEPAFGA